jgi:regulatory subunit for Cdc7p protein kinase
MAAVAAPPSQPAMTTRRVPLASLQNATNSPMRVTTTAGAKRQRSHASEQRDMLYSQPPPKKQLIEVDDAEARRHGLIRRSNAPTTALTRKLEAARENKPPPKPVDRAQRAANDLETIRQWQRHYRKLFPQFSFYFDSVSEPQKDKLMSRAMILGSVRLRRPDAMLCSANRSTA